jgi:uncharacterized iron-regulated membrane protein
MGQRAIKGWYLVHKWTSLVCTAFLLMLCVTGLPLIFHQELEDALGRRPDLPAAAAGTAPPSLDSMAAAVKAARPGEVIQSAYSDETLPLITFVTAKTPDAPFEAAHLQAVDLRTGTLVALPPPQEGFLYLMEELHIRMFAGLAGTLFLGLMGVVFLASMVSGVVVYAPFMRKLPFATVRKTRSPRVKWLDAHNMIGIVTAAWLFVVGFTGVFNTLDLPLAMSWRTGQLAEMTAPYRNLPPPSHIGSLDAAVATARAASPGMEPATISWPGTFFSTPHHFNVFLRGATPVTERLLKPSLIDAETGKLTATADMPLYIRALFLSRPLHFGDYGGLALKVIWALLDLAAIVVLGSGLYLWIGRRRAPLEKRLAELQAGAAS